MTDLSTERGLAVDLTDLTRVYGEVRALDGLTLQIEPGEELLSRFPFGRLGEPDDPARLIAWLVSDEARWVTGQVITTDGGFSLN